MLHNINKASHWLIFSFSVLNSCVNNLQKFTEFLITQPSVSDSTVVLEEMSLVLMVLVPLFSNYTHPPKSQWYCICINYRLYFSELYLSKLQHVFVQLAKYICKICKIYLSKSRNVAGADGLAPPFEPLRPSSQWWSHPSLMVLLVTIITFDDISRVYFSIMHSLNENWASLLQIKYIRINRRVDALCFVNSTKNMPKWLKTAALFRSPLPSIVWSQWRALVSGGVLQSNKVY